MSFDAQTEESNLETCLKISAFFEGGSFNTRFDTVTGNFDGQGLSAGALQFAAGQGSLSHFLSKCLQNMDEGVANGYFSAYGSSIITNMSKMDAAQAKNFALANFINMNNSLKPDAAAAWKAFLLDPNVLATQKQVIKDDILAKAYKLAEQFVPWDSENLRVISFFFDIVVQSGGMSNSRGSVSPVAQGDYPSYELAIQASKDQGMTWVPQKWTEATDAEEISKTLLHYAYERAQLSLAQWRWNTLARRGTIATRWGYVNKTKIDLTSMLP